MSNSPRAPNHAALGSNRRVSLSRRLSASVLPAEDAHAFASSFNDAMTSNSAATLFPHASVGGAPLAGTLPQSKSTQSAAFFVSQSDIQLSPTSSNSSFSSSDSTTLANSDNPGRPPTPPSQHRNSSTGTLRSRRTSLSRLPSTPLTAPPSSNSSLPSPTLFLNSNLSSSSTSTRKEVGLGLMLDEEAALAGGGSGTSSAEYNGKRDAPSIGGSATARAREMLARLGLTGSEADGEEPYTGHGLDGAGSTPSSTSSGTSEWEPFDRPSNASTPSKTAISHASMVPTIPRLSTTGGTSPLLVFTGTPLLSPRTNSFAPSSSSAYGHPNPPIHRAPSPSRFLAQSVAMDRSGSGSLSRTSSDVHSRQQSLTSACPPATSSVPAPLPLLNNAELYPPSSPLPSKGWKSYDWGTPTSSSNSPRIDDPRKGGKSYSSSSSGAISALAGIVNLPTALLSFFLAPLTSSYHPPPVLTGATAPTSLAGGVGGLAGGKRWPFPIRLLTVAYLIFSCLFLAARITSPNAETRIAGGMRIGPRGSGGIDGSVELGHEGRLEDANNYMLGKVGEGVGGWAQKVAQGVRWPRPKGEETVDEEKRDEEVTLLEEEPVPDVLEGWGTVRRIGSEHAALRTPENNPLTAFTHTYRLAKMHDKVHWDLPDEIEPFIFRATGAEPDANDTTACLYSNEAWISTLPTFLAAWRGRVSLVFEVAHSRGSPRRATLLESINALRESDELVRSLVDFHLVGSPSSMGERTLNKTRERMILNPVGWNFHLNLARFFAPTDIVYIVGDPRIVPSQGLHQRLRAESIQTLILDKGDAIVIPTFGFVRNPSGEPMTKATTAHDIRRRLGYPRSGTWDGVGADEFESIGQEHVRELDRTLPLPLERWPQKKAALVGLVRTRVGTPDHPSESVLALHDRRWDLNHGPSNWYLWRKSPTDPRLLEPPELGGGIGLGPNGGVGGGRDVFRVTDYDLHYSPSVVVSRKGQPWCTERFEMMPAACVYQMYLSGAEMWVLPDEWAFTVEAVDKFIEPTKEDPAEKLRKSISSRLYGKFHQEACMHYGREFLSIQMWNSDKAQHLRSVCARTLGTWGMGESP